MKKNVTLIDFSDLLFYAESIGIPWNQAHEFLVKDGVYPLYESSTQDLYHDVASDYGWSDESSKIIEGFLTANELDECILIK